MHNFSSTVSGNIVREDPELRYTPGGTAAVSFTIAVKERQKNAQGQWEVPRPRSSTSRRSGAKGA